MIMLKRKEDAARLKHEELGRYRVEYQERLSGTSRVGMDIHLLRDYHAFLHKLEQAIANQAGEVEALRQRWQMAHDNWLDLRQRVKSFEVLETRHRQAELLRQDRREQRQNDEYSGRKAALVKSGEPH